MCWKVRDAERGPRRMVQILLGRRWFRGRVRKVRSAARGRWLFRLLAAEEQAMAVELAKADVCFVVDDFFPSACNLRYNELFPAMFLRCC